MRDLEDSEYFQKHSNYNTAINTLRIFKEECEKYNKNFRYELELLLEEC